MSPGCADIMAVVPLCRITPAAAAPTPSLKVSTRPAMRRVELICDKPVTTPLRPSLSRASETAQQSSAFNRVAISLATPSALIALLSEILLPIHESHRVSRPGLGAVTRHVIYERHLLARSIHSSGQRDPIPHLAGIAQQIILGNRRQRRFVAILHGLDHALIE